MPDRAAVYVRISVDRARGTGDEGLGVARQEHECRALCQRKGWSIAAVYVDNDTSASIGRRRPGYQRLLADLESRAVDAVVVWDLDRLHRRPVELESFIDLADRLGVDLANVTGDVDLSTPAGRLHARIMGAVARHEIEHKSERQRAANQQRAERGRPWAGGRRAFGYERDGMSVVPAEAEHIRWAMRNLLSGASLRAVAKNLSERGVSTTQGGPWTPTELRRMIQRPRLAGLLSYQGRVVGRGVWEAILSEDEHLELRALFAEPRRHRAGRPRAHLLSGVASCAACGALVYGTTEVSSGRAYYFCSARKHMVRSMRPVDEYVSDVVLARLSQPDAANVLAPTEHVDAVTGLRRERSELATRQEKLAMAWADGSVADVEWAAARRRLADRMKEIEQALTVAVGTRPASRLAMSENVRTSWEIAGVEERREVVRLLLTVSLHAPGRGARRFEPQTVSLIWRADSG